MKILAFKAQPKNYLNIDKSLSRSAQPEKDDFIWLKEHGVTDVVNFRTMHTPDVDFDEKKVVEDLGMKYHNIPTITFKPNENKVKQFLDLVEKIKQAGGKAHIHCKAGADRTGMYAFIYKAIQGLGSLFENEKEWIDLGHNTQRFPDLRSWAKEFVRKNKL